MGPRLFSVFINDLHAGLKSTPFLDDRKLGSAVDGQECALAARRAGRALGCLRPGTAGRPREGTA